MINSLLGMMCNIMSLMIFDILPDSWLLLLGLNNFLLQWGSFCKIGLQCRDRSQFSKMSILLSSLLLYKIDIDHYKAYTFQMNYPYKTLSHKYYTHFQTDTTDNHTNMAYTSYLNIPISYTKMYSLSLSMSL